MLPYFPFGNEFDHRMGTAPLQSHESLVEVDGDYIHEIIQKRALLAHNHRYYFQASPILNLPSGTYWNAY